MNGTQSKFVLKSETILGGLLMLLPAILSMFGIDLSADQLGAIGDFSDQLIAFIGFGFVAHGRFTATQSLTVAP